MAGKMSEKSLLTPVALAALFISGFSVAEDPIALNPEMYTVLFEDDHIRVIDVKYRPGESDAPHSHPEYAAYVVEPGVLRMRSQTSEEEQDVRLERGETLLLQAVEGHWAENISDSVVHAILIEFKPLSGENQSRRAAFNLR